MKVEHLKLQLKNGFVQPAYAVFGNDRFLIEQAKKMLCMLVSLPQLNVQTFDDTADVGTIISSCESIPMMSLRRVVFVSLKKNIDSKLLEYCQRPNISTVLVLMCGESLDDNISTALSRLNASAKPTKTDTAQSTCTVETIDCNHLDETGVYAFIERTAPKRFPQVSKKMLYNYTLGDLTRISSEIKKLQLFMDSTNPSAPITTNIIDTLVSKDAEYKIYELTSAVFRRQTNVAYSMLSSLLLEMDSLAILKSLHTQTRKFFFAKINGSNLSTFSDGIGQSMAACKYTVKDADSLSMNFVKNVYTHLSDMDYKIKTGQITSKNALDLTMQIMLAGGETC